jgi:hypothetical protein
MTINMTSRICFLIKGVAYEYFIDTSTLNYLMKKYKKSHGRLLNAIKKKAYDWQKL